MIRYFCDSCEKELESSELVHIEMVPLGSAQPQKYTTCEECFHFYSRMLREGYTKKCTWTEDSTGGHYNTSCGSTVYFGKKYKYCHYCGKEVE